MRRTSARETYAKMKLPPQNSLTALLAHCWSLLHKAANDYTSPMHTPVLGTMGETLGLRTVVLREFAASDPTLRCHTDWRSAKISQIQLNSTAHWLFYDVLSKQQIRVSGPTALHTDDATADRLWELTSETARALYEQPQTPGDPYASSAPASRSKQSNGRANFAVVETRITQIDNLMLGDDTHCRAKYHWNGEAFEGYWAVP